MVKKVLSYMLVLTLLLSLLPAAALAASAGLGNFKTVQTYQTGRFTDVAASAWYEENVKTAYELDLVKGVSDTAFNPSGNITVAATLALACRLHSIYQTGSAEFVQGSPWYQVYVDYAVKNGIITAGQYTNYNAYATRAQFAAILAKALPESALEAKNKVDDGMIPDVDNDAAYRDDIYLLYRAGVLTGNDAKGTFTPNSTIQRSAVAAIVSRMALPSMRQSIALEAEKITSVTLDKSSTVVEVGKTVSLFPSVQPSGASVKTLTWKSSNTSVATVNASGTVTGVKKGTATITASAPSGAKATCTVTVAEAPVEVTGVSLNKRTMYLYAGETERLNATLQPSNATDTTLSWTSSNTSVATVSSSGTVTARKEGTATITVKTGNGKTATCTVTVYPEIEVTSVTVSPGTLELEVGETSKLSCSLRPTNATDQDVSWTSSDTSVATVSSSGTVTAKGAGSAKITATAASGRSDYCRVTVTESLLPTFSTPKLNYNYGPMTVTAYYSSGGVQYVNRLTRVEFTEATPYSSGENVSLKLMLQGTSTTSNLYVRVNFYDAGGSLLDTDYAAVSVTANQEFAVERSLMVSSSALEKTSRLEFVSYSNNVAEDGITESTTPDPGDYEMYYGYDIPSFDDFTNASRSSLSSSSSYVTGYLYTPVSSSEMNAYFQALEDCGFTQQISIGTMYTFTKGTSGTEDFMEVRFNYTSVDATVRVGLSKIRPSNEWTSGATDPTGGDDEVDAPDPDKVAAVQVGARLESCYSSAMSHLEPVQGYMETVYEYMYDNPYGAANVVGWCVSGLESFQGDVNSVVSVCGSNTYWSEVKGMAQDLYDEMDDTIAIFESVRDNTSPTTTNVIQARNAYLELLSAWTDILSASNDVLNSL